MQPLHPLAQCICQIDCRNGVHHRPACRRRLHPRRRCPGAPPGAQPGCARRHGAARRGEWAGGPKAAQCAGSMQPQAAHRPLVLPAGEDRDPRGRPRVCQGRGGGGHHRGRHPAAQLRAEAAHAGHRAERRRRQGGQGAPPAAAAALASPSLPALLLIPCFPPAGGRQGGLLQVCRHRAGAAGGELCAAQGGQAAGSGSGSF